MAEIIILGDSHITALQRGHGLAGGGLVVGRSAFISRFTKLKDGVVVPGVTIEEAYEMLGRLGPDDLFVVVPAGNEFNIFGMIQHPVPFDYVEPDLPGPLLPGTQLIPSRMLEAMLEPRLVGANARRMKGLRGATVAPMMMLAPPPPKEDDAFVRDNAERFFKASNVAILGVSPARLRLKLWFTQTRLMRRACEAMGIVFLLPPPAALTPDGFLDPRYYGKDATHANPAYGALVLEMLDHQAALLGKAA